MTQQVGASEQHRLSKQLERLKGIEKSEIRMIEADRQRFRMKYRKRDFSKASLTVKDAKINDVAILDDGRQTIAENNGNEPLSSKKFLEESHDYEAVRSLIFTDGKVDLDKILCLHLMSVHVIDVDEAELQLITHKNGQSREVVGTEESENDILPCYVVEIQRDESSSSSSSSRFLKRQEEEQEEEISQLEGQLRYRQQSSNNAESAFRLANRGMPAPSAAGKMPIVSPSLYNSLLESHTRQGNASVSPSLEHLQKYIHTGQMFNKFDERIADKLLRVQSSARYARAVCKNEKYYICSEPSSVASKLPRNQYRPILICINTQLKSIVQTVVGILRNTNREKTNSLVDMLKSSEIVAAKLSEMEDLINSLENFSFLLPESFTCVPGYAIEDAQSDDKKIGKHPVAKTLILESEDISVFDRVLENVRKSIDDFCKIRSSESNSSESSLENVSMLSLISQTSTVNPRASRTSFSVGRSVEKVESNNSSTKSYEMIQQEFNEAANARLANVKNIKKGNAYTDPDRIILRRMTNSQRILVGQLCAALKTKKINNEGMAKEKIPLPALLKPVLSRESINYLIQGTIYAKNNNIDAAKAESKPDVSQPTINLTDFILTKIYHEVLEVESRSQLQNFMNVSI